MPLCPALHRTQRGSGVERGEDPPQPQGARRGHSLLTTLCWLTTFNLSRTLPISARIPPGGRGKAPAVVPAAGSELTGVDLCLVVHVYLQEPDKHAEEDPQELQVGASLPHLVKRGLGRRGAEKRDFTREL